MFNSLRKKRFGCNCAYRFDASRRRNADFVLADLEPGQQWLQHAAAANMAKQAEEQRAAPREGMTADEITCKGGLGEGFSWAQTDEEIEVTVFLSDVPGRVRGKDCVVKIERQRLTVSIMVSGSNEKAVDLDFMPLFASVRPDDSTWTLDDAGLVVTMEKASEGQVWNALT